jgi:periplasmic protein TonB
VIQPDGTATDLKIVKSLDPVFGLDQEAIKALRQWRFRPARKAGQPVAYGAIVQLDFTLR